MTVGGVDVNEEILWGSKLRKPSLEFRVLGLFGNLIYIS